jgi:membrane-bound serine protease (ClpP class)
MEASVQATTVKKVWVLLAVIIIAMAWFRSAGGQIPQENPESYQGPRALVLDVEGPIGPATRDFILRSLEKAVATNASLVIIRLDTPGGLDASTRDIVKAILSSPVPFATWVAPEGARAASAGTYILYASHVAAMSPATNVGAATPVAIGVGNDRSPLGPSSDKGRPGSSRDEQGVAPEEEDKTGANESLDAMVKKAVNDSVAWIRGLAELRGRNADWAEQSVREAHSINSKEALERGVIDLVANDLGDLLAQADGRKVKVNGLDVTLQTRGLAIDRIAPDWRNELLAVITSPTIAYLLLLIGIYGLVLEGYNPGALVPGVVGAICLLLALYALQMLPVNYAGLGLILLGVILIIAEVMMPSFGVLGIGGIIAMVIGSIILIDTDAPGFAVSRSLIGAVAATGSLGLMAIIWLAVKARNRPVVSGREQLVGERGSALGNFNETGEVFVHSERWKAVSTAPVLDGQPVEVIAVNGLTLRVRPLDE